MDYLYLAVSLIVVTSLIVALIIVHRRRNRPASPGAVAAPIPIDPDLPEWARFFRDRQRFDRFLMIVENELKRREIPHRIEDGYVLIPAEPGSDEPRQLGLLNLAQLCHGNEEYDWPNLVGHHLDLLDAQQKENDELDARADDFAQVRHQVVARLWADDTFEGEMAQTIIARTDLPRVHTVLMFDLPNVMRSVSNDYLDKWQLSADQLFDIALENTWTSCQPKWEQTQLGEDITVHLLGDDSFLTATHALFLDRHPHLTGSHGALVAIPHRHVLIVYPINDMNVVQALNALIPVALGMFEEGPGSVSPSVYWYSEGHYEEIPATLEDKTLAVRPPQPFIDMLNQLSEAEATN